MYFLSRCKIKLLWWLAAVTGGLLSAGVMASPDRGPDSRHFPKLHLAEHSRGQTAIKLLGPSLPSVAQAYGLDAFALRVRLSGDNTLAVDGGGRLYYAEPAQLDAVTLVADVTVSTPLPAPLADTFRLHSRPSATRLIYLDFTGFVLTDTAWNYYNAGNPIVAPAWSIDADPTTFNDAERSEIQYIWQRVAEDYAPFDVDVTTELTSEDQLTRSDTSDQYYGARVLISPISSIIGLYGGLAFLGVFDAIGDYYKPALVFPENLGPNLERYLAAVISHEVGHNFNLAHDGTSTDIYSYGHGNWAPIMGVGYNPPIVQWSQGEYADANNIQDDLAVIAGYVGYRLDDHGDTPATATILPLSSQLSAAGVISSGSDVDVFGFVTEGGAVSIELNPDSRSANLDILAEVRDSTDNVIATSQPLGALNASFNLSLNAGTYYIYIRGTGEGSPLDTGYSAYGSIGQYTITGTVGSAGLQPPVAVATASPTVMTLGQAATFDGTGSYDPNGGSIVGYDWAFSDGASAQGAVVTKMFGSPGTFAATLTVRNGNGCRASSAISVRVNNPPTAEIGVSPDISGVAPLALRFTGADSADTDGTITRYAWKFGDGTTGTGVTVSKTYKNAGIYVAQLTVTDNNGGIGIQTVAISVAQKAALIIRLESIGLNLKGSDGNWAGVATIKVTNLNGTAVSGVNVSGTWTGAITGKGSDGTDGAGEAMITSAKTRKTGLSTFTVTAVARNGYTYSAANNLVSSASINVP